MEKNFNHFLVDRSSRYLKGTAFKELYILEFFTDDMNTECVHMGVQNVSARLFSFFESAGGWVVCSTQVKVFSNKWSPV